MPSLEIDYDDVMYEDRVSVDWHEEELDYPSQQDDIRDEWLTEIWNDIQGGENED